MNSRDANPIILVLFNSVCLMSDDRQVTVRNSSCGKVMFSQACVKNSVHGVYTPKADTPPPETATAMYSSLPIYPHTRTHSHTCSHKTNARIYLCMHSRILKCVQKITHTHTHTHSNHHLSKRLKA